MKHTNWVDNYQIITTAKYGLHHFTRYEEKKNLTNFQ